MSLEDDWLITLLTYGLQKCFKASVQIFNLPGHIFNIGYIQNPPKPCISWCS